MGICRHCPSSAVKMKLNISYPANGSQKLFEIEEDRKLRVFMDKRMGNEVPADSLGDEWKGYIVRITGGNDKQGFPMKQGVSYCRCSQPVSDSSSPKGTLATDPDEQVNEEESPSVAASLLKIYLFSLCRSSSRVSRTSQVLPTLSTQSDSAPSEPPRSEDSSA